MSYPPRQVLVFNPKLERYRVLELKYEQQFHRQSFVDYKGLKTPRFLAQYFVAYKGLFNVG